MTENNPDLEISNLSEDKKSINRGREIIFGSFLFILGVLLFISFCSYFYNWQADQSTLDSLSDREIQSENVLNKIGAWISHFFIFNLFGLVSFIFTFLLCYTGVSLFFNKLKATLLKTIVDNATTFFDNPDKLAEFSYGLKDAMKGLDISEIPEEEMKNVFNLGIGYCVVVPANVATDVQLRIYGHGMESWVFGDITTINT